MSLIHFLKSSPKARKIFGHRELEIIGKQLAGFPLTQSEKNRLSRDIRPKLDFVKEISPFEDEFKLIKNQDNKKMIEDAVAVILADKLKPQIKAILLFGSFADNSFTVRSDIDLCVLFQKDLSSEETTRFRIRVLGQLPDKFDVQVFNDLPQKIKKDIARNHRVLYEEKTFDNLDFSIQYLKDDDYFIRMDKIFGAEA